MNKWVKSSAPMQTQKQKKKKSKGAVMRDPASRAVAAAGRFMISKDLPENVYATAAIKETQVTGSAVFIELRAPALEIPAYELILFARALRSQGRDGAVN